MCIVFTFQAVYWWEVVMLMQWMYIGDRCRLDVRKCQWVLHSYFYRFRLSRTAKTQTYIQCLTADSFGMRNVARQKACVSFYPSLHILTFDGGGSKGESPKYTASIGRPNFRIKKWFLLFGSKRHVWFGFKQKQFFSTYVIFDMATQRSPPLLASVLCQSQSSDAVTRSSVT